MHLIVSAASALTTIAPIIMQMDESTDLAPVYVVELSVSRVEDGKGNVVASPRLVVPAGQRAEVVVEATDDLLVEIKLKAGRPVESSQHRAKFTLTKVVGETRQTLAQPELLVKTGQKGQVVIADESGRSYSCEIIVQRPKDTIYR